MKRLLKIMKIQNDRSTSLACRPSQITSYHNVANSRKHPVILPSHHSHNFGPFLGFLTMNKKAPHIPIAMPERRHECHEYLTNA